MPIKASSPTLALKAPVYRFRFAFGIGLLVSHAQQNPKSLTYSLVRILGSISLHPEMGTPQGGVISPVLANVYLHYALDLWFEQVVGRNNQGCCKLFRFADDFVGCFEYRHEAVAFERALLERMKQYGLELVVDKTKTIRFGRNGGPYNGRF